MILNVQRFKKNLFAERKNQDILAKKFVNASYEWPILESRSSSSGYSDGPFRDKRIYMIGLRRSVKLVELCR